ncbi:MAG: glycosyltransferase family 9 protein [Candidatus Aureabacteria bacterium]|nr:glycosyltransferase family 9 protein [Candidatus Auribacterota bacterium]
MKVLIFRSSFYAHIEAVVKYVLENNWVKPDLVAHKDDIERYSQIKAIKTIISYDGPRQFSLKTFPVSKFEELKKNEYDLILIPCNFKNPAGFKNVYSVARKIVSREKIRFVNPELEIIRPDLWWNAKEALLKAGIFLFKLSDFVLRYIPRRKGTALIISIDYLGDTVSTIRAVYSLKEEKLKQVKVLIKEEYAELVKESNRSTAYISMRKGIFPFIILLFRFIFIIRFEKAAILFPGKSRFAILSLTLGIPHRSGYPSPVFYHPFSYVYDKTISPEGTEDLVYYAFKLMLFVLDGDINKISADYPLLSWLGSGEDEKKDSILFVPTSGWVHRRILASEMMTMIEALKGRFSVITVYASEDYLDEVKSLLESESLNNINLKGFYPTIQELISFIRRFSHVVGINTGILHLAAGMGKKVFCIIGPSPVFTAMPIDDTNIFYNKDVKCRPCKQYGWSKCPKDMYCLREINYEKIGEEIEEDARLQTQDRKAKKTVSHKCTENKCEV